MELSKRISEWISDRVKEAGAKGLVVGISGGVDSAVVASLARRALGENMLGLIMPCGSPPEDVKDAKEVSKGLKIRTEYVNLNPILKRFLEVLPKGERIPIANLKARLRMVTLYYYANQLNYLVAGTGNRSEIDVGYFTKYGDGAADLLPIGGLLKGQVKELAKELAIPEKIINKTPSAGLWEGQTDEGELGISYEELDKALLALQSGGIGEPKTLAQVRKLVSSSEHKRSSVPKFIP